MKLPSLRMKKSLTPSMNRSMAARMKPHSRGIPRIKINKGLAPKMPHVKL